MREAGGRALLAIGSVVLALGGLEGVLRVRPPDDYAVNDPYKFTEFRGRIEFRIPFHSYSEVYPLAFDVRGYYRRSGGVVDYHFDQFGGRWLRPEGRALASRVALVVGDSFTLGFGVRYEDTWVDRLERALEEQGRPRSLVNLAEPGADARRCLAIARETRERVPHDLLLYGLHLNDLIEFDTSYVATDAAGGASRSGWMRARSRLASFVLGRLENGRRRREKVRELTAPERLRSPFFQENLEAIARMRAESAEHGKRLRVILLPILVDLREETFETVYRGIRAAFAARGIPYLDLTRSLPPRPDAEYWILPFDQHPNEIAHAAFARRLAAVLEGAER